ncbi:MAG: diguanylate cyclase [Lachnospiraceae bacterium]|nr:diguanylate cyclase [Lachnospiraceae bacterium]
MNPGNMYAITALVCALVCISIFRCNNIIYEKDSVIRSYFSFLLVNYIICNLIDCLWGLMYTKTFYPGRISFYVVSFIINLYIIFTVACWCIFLTSYFGFRESRAVMVLQTIPLVIAVFIMLTQIMGNTVFVIDPNGNYSAGPYRRFMFYIQYGYFIIPLFKIAYFVIKNRKELDIKYILLVAKCAVIPAGFGTLQYYHPNAPYSSLGLMFSAAVVFNGMMVIDKHKRALMYETVSKDTYMTLEALSDGFVAVLLIDLDKGNVTPIKSLNYVKKLIEPDIPVRESILKVFRNAVCPDGIDEMTEFADIDLLPQRMENRRTISHQYCSKDMGWCVLSFIAAQRDKARNLKKVVMAIQSIDESKKKEIEFREALSRAYQNENAVFAELMKMESTGIVASSDRKIMIVNDAALRMFGREGENYIEKNVFDLWKDTPIRTPDEVKDKFLEVEANGGEFTYETVLYDEGSDKDIEYLMTDVKRVDLLDGTKVMITCFTDITEGKLLEDKLRTLSETDPLCGIANRRSGESQIKVLMKEGIGGIFCLFDVNDFKTINDTNGHQTGDDTLVAVSNALKASFRADDIFMRLGGDEFAIYMRGVATSELAKIRIARLFENIARIELEGIPKGSVTISLGAVMVPSVDGVVTGKYDDIYSRADRQMYKCKGKPGSNMSIEEPEERKENEES